MTNKKPLEDNGTFCVLPWIHIHSWPDGASYLCCIADTGNQESQIGDLTTNTIAEIMNNDRMKEIRRDMLAGKKVSNCKHCNNIEELRGGYSWRNGFNRQFVDIIPDLVANTQEDGTIDPKMLFVDFRFSNLCNLECRSCGAHLSSSIASRQGRGFPDDVREDFKKRNILGNNEIISFTNPKPNFISDDLMQYLPETRCLYFAGGEPLIQQEHYDILNYLYKNEWFDKELRYSTNLSNLKYRGIQLLDLWSKFDNVWVMCSIDHCGEKLEYLRQGVNSSRLFNNFDMLVKTPSIKLSITTVVSIYNIYYLYDFIKFLDDNNYINRLYSIEILYAFGGNTSPALLPEWAKQDLIEKIDQDSKSELYKKIGVDPRFPAFSSSIEGLKKYIYEDCHVTFDEFIDFTSTFDNAYNKNVKTVFPWLGNVIEKYNSQDQKNV